MWHVIRAQEMAFVSVFSPKRGCWVYVKPGLRVYLLLNALCLKTCWPLALVQDEEFICFAGFLSVPFSFFTRNRQLNSGLQTCDGYMVGIPGGEAHLGTEPLCTRTPVEKVCRGHELALNPLVKSRWSQTIVSVCCKWYASGFEQSSAKSPTWHGNLSWSQVCRVKVM